MKSLHPIASGQFNALSLFSGAMGLDLGLERAGINMLGCLELNPQAVASIRNNRPEIPVLECDISTMDPDDGVTRLGIFRQTN